MHMTPTRDLKHLADRLGTDDPNFAEQTALRTFTTYAPHERQDIIEKTEAAISQEDDGTSLRQKSQLMDFQ